MIYSSVLHHYTLTEKHGKVIKWPDWKKGRREGRLGKSHAENKMDCLAFRPKLHSGRNGKDTWEGRKSRAEES